MKETYVIGIDQSTQGTKALLFDREGKLLLRTDRAHAQLIDERGWVEHDPEEIYRNTRTNEGTEIKREQETAQSGPSTIEAVSRAAPELTEQQKKVYDALTGRPQNLNEIAQRCGMSVAEVTALLFEIGVPEPVRMYPGMLFSI